MSAFREDLLLVMKERGREGESDWGKEESLTFMKRGKESLDGCEVFKQTIGTVYPACEGTFWI